MYLHKISALLLGMGSIHFAYATVGGSEIIEMIGYSAREQKVYVLRHFEDGRGRLPQLYYYDFSQKNAVNYPLIQVDSLYINQKTGKIDYDHPNEVIFDRELDRIKRRTQPLIPLNPAIFEVEIQQRNSSTQHEWHDVDSNDQANPVVQYIFQYKVKNRNYQSPTQTAKTFSNQLDVKQAYRIPQQNKLLVTIDYFGIPLEQGYHIEDPVLLQPQP